MVDCARLIRRVRALFFDTRLNGVGGLENLDTTTSKECEKAPASFSVPTSLVLLCLGAGLACEARREKCGGHKAPIRPFPCGVKKFGKVGKVNIQILRLDE